MAIKKGDPQDIATKGLLQPGDPISPATEGIIETVSAVSDIVTDGSGEIIITLTYTTEGGVVIADSAAESVTHAVASTGAVTISGAATDIFIPSTISERGGKGTPGKKHYQRQNLATIYKYLGGSRKSAVTINGLAETAFTYSEPSYIIPPEEIEHNEVEDFVERLTDRFINVDPVSFDYSASGGIEFANKSILTEAVTKATDYSYDSTGSIEVAGGATHNQELTEPNIFDYVSSGGIEIIGEVSIEDIIAQPVIFDYVSSGGVEIVGKTIIEHVDYELVVLKILDEEFLELEASIGRTAIYLREIAEEIINNPRSTFEYTASGNIKISGKANTDIIDISYLRSLDEEYLKLDVDKAETNLYLNRIIEEVNKKTPAIFEHIATGIVGIEGKSMVEHMDRTNEIIASDEEFLLNYHVTENSVASGYVITQNDTIEQELPLNITQYVEDSILLYDMDEEMRSIVMEEVLNSIQYRKINSARDIDSEILAMYELL